jgi:FHA domain
MPETHETRAPSARELQAVIHAERTGLPFLIWRDGAGEQHILLLEQGRGQVIIGRRSDCDIALTWDDQVSRAHGLLEPIGEEWALVDNGSRNGSYVNGDRIHGRHRLRNREHMTFGRTRVEFRHPTDDAGSMSTARAGEASLFMPLTETQRKVLIALCRPVVDNRSATPATNPQIAAEVNTSIDAVKARLRELFDRFGLGDLPQNEKRSRLVSLLLSSGVLAPHDF